MPCKRQMVEIKETVTEDIFWKTNWTSEFFLEADSRSLVVIIVYIPVLQQPTELWTLQF